MIFHFFVRRAGLYCLLSTEEGIILADSINMFYSLAAYLLLRNLSFVGNYYPGYLELLSA